ncbi:MAG: TetR/AcrR family transcriptional regulator [Mycobacterium sp.]|nr:TetR/AcrR family transcriptional regulator [Mycobacterium sp.]
MIPDAAPGPERSRPLRADAERNRERILAAASELFAERGLTVPLEEVARAAEVGVATLYRRFPTRTDLAIAVFERNMAAYSDVVDRALAQRSAADGFRQLIVDLCALQASDPGRRALFTTAFPASSLVERTVSDAVEKVRELVERAQREGAVRPDVGVGDVVVMLLANAGVLEATHAHAPGAWRRFAALMLDALCGGPDTDLPPPTPPEDLRRSIAMLTQDARTQSPTARSTR